MGDIYKKAREVVIWLGDEEHGSDSGIAIQVLRDLRNEFGDFVDNSRDFDALDEQLDNISSVEEEMRVFREIFQMESRWVTSSDFFSRQTTRAWEAVAKLMMRSWFHRIWTYQEKALARSAVVLVGSEEISWVQLATALQLIIANDSANGRAPVVPKGEYRFFFDSNISRATKASEVVPSLNGLLERVKLARRRECRDPRDRIFAILSSANEGDAGFSHFASWVDYERVTTQALYTEFARF
jgi:hypothetical protein